MSQAIPGLMGGGARAVTYLGLALGIFIAALDQTVVVTALPSIISDLQIPFTELNRAAWIVTGYLLGYTVAMPLFGRVSDVYGRRRTYVVCLLVFIAGSLLCSFARDLYWLIGGRLVQAAGGGAIVPVVMSIAGDELEGGRRTLALGAIGAVAEAGGVLGPLYGAVIVEHLSWQWIFYLNVPLGALVIGAAYWRSKPDIRGHGKIDLLGAVLIGSSLGALALALSADTSPGASAWPRMLLLVLALFLLGMFVWRELRVSQPLLDLRIFRVKPIITGNLANFLVGVALITAMVDVPLFAATILQRTPLAGGLMLMRLTVALPVGAIIGGVLSPRVGARATAGLGLLCAAAGLLLVGLWSAGVDEVSISRDLALAGFGFGVVIAPITSTVLAAVEASERGVASALVTVMRMVGMMVGLSALTAWGLGRFNAMMAGVPLPLPLPNELAEITQQRIQAYQERLLDATLSIFHEVFWAAAIICLIAIGAAVFFTARKPISRNAGPPCAVDS